LVVDRADLRLPKLFPNRKILYSDPVIGNRKAFFLFDLLVSAKVKFH